jgi:hypothetical protein
LEANKQEISKTSTFDVHIQPKMLIVDVYVAKQLTFLKQQAKSFVTTCLINTIKIIHTSQAKESKTLSQWN